MDAKQVIADIRRAVGEVKAQDDDVISVAALERYLGELEERVGKVGEIDEPQLDSQASFRAEHESNLAHYNVVQKQSLEMLRSVISYGQASLKSSILINGGAAAGLLAFIGKIWGSTITVPAVNALTISVLLFSCGVVASALGTGTTYVTQYSYMNAWNRAGIGFHIASVILVLVSFILFGLGSYKAYIAFVEHLSPN